MQFFKEEKIFDFMGKRKLFLPLSGIFIIVSFVMLFTQGLNFGIDFKGGVVVQVKFNKEAPIAEVRNLVSKEYNGAVITHFGSKEEIVIKLSVDGVKESVTKDIGDVMRITLKPLGEFEIRRVDIVGAKVGGELREKGLMALFVAIVGVLLYVAFRFEWRFAVASVLALIHDVSIAIGFIVLFQVDVNLDVLAALLTILGYSLNDTIVVFDRIREELQTTKEKSLATLINISVSKTLSRTTLTSLTTFFVVLTLYLFGGEIINPFSFVLLVGVIVGTYSSIFIASPFLILLGFKIEAFKQKEATKEKKRREKEKLRAQFEQGVM